MSDRRLLACSLLSASFGAFVIGMPIKWIALYHLGSAENIPVWFFDALCYPMCGAAILLILSWNWITRIDNAERKEWDQRRFNHCYLHSVDRDSLDDESRA